MPRTLVAQISPVRIQLDDVNAGRRSQSGRHCGEGGLVAGRSSRVAAATRTTAAVDRLNGRLVAFGETRDGVRRRVLGRVDTYYLWRQRVPATGPPNNGQGHARFEGHEGVVNRKDERVSALVIDDVEIARALHVVFVAHWIGGVAFVTSSGCHLRAHPATRRKAGRCSRRSKPALRRRFVSRFRLPARPGSGWRGGSISGACSPARRSGGWMPWSCSGRCLC